MVTPLIARIVTNLALDREFDYAVPAALHSRIHIGSKVRVPFGRSKELRPGFVVAFSETSECKSLKEIAELEDDRPLIPRHLIELAGWIAEYYCCSKEQAVRSMLPSAVRSGKISVKKQKFVNLSDGISLSETMQALEKKAPKQALILQELIRQERECLLSKLVKEAKCTHQVVRALEEKGLVEINEKTVARDPFADDHILSTEPLALTPDQQSTLKTITANLDEKKGSTILLHGVTASGKTEVYLQAIQHCLQLERHAILLVPEISLTPQTTNQFRARFGDTHISVMHSGLSDGERLDEWRKIRDGQSKIVIGARSALFAPLPNTGLIIVDEEHEHTYKQGEAPRYNARDMAVLRAKREGATTVLGSATPSLESYYNCELGKYELVKMPTRIDDRPMPEVEIIDMAAEATEAGGGQLFSRRLIELVKDRLANCEQTLFFLNRRGYATQMLCEKCGFVAMCDECSIAYTYHRGDNQLICHLCGYVKTAPTQCPECGTDEIRYSGVGTEKIEAITKNIFPHARIARMDADTMRGKGAHHRIINEFQSGQIDILIGTQMIAKGLHFPKVTLVGVIFADMGLHIPDFRASERTMQLLTQVAGRAGRSDRPGHVIIQTHTPYHPVFMMTLEHDFEGFAEEELEARKALSFPPATHCAIIHFRGEAEFPTQRFAEEFGEHLKKHLPETTHFSMPAPSPVAKIKNKFRFQMLLRDANINRLVKILRYIVLQTKPPKDIEVYVDVDPYSLM